MTTIQKAGFNLEPFVTLSLLARYLYRYTQTGSKSQVTQSVTVQKRLIGGTNLNNTG